MSDIDDGGPAFPTEMDGINEQGRDGVFGPYPGMTLRDWFAGQAAFTEDKPAIYEAKAVMGEEPPAWPPFNISNDYEGMKKCIHWWATARSRLRFLEADAMLSARKGKPDA